MKTLIEDLEQRVAFYAALARYMAQLFIEKDRVHYASKKWWRDILIEFPKSALASALLLTTYFLVRIDPSYDFIISILLAVQPLAYFIFVALRGYYIYIKAYKERSFEEAPFYLRAYFLHSAVEYAYLNCFNGFLTIKDLDRGIVNEEKRKLLSKAAEAPFWPTDVKKPWELRMPKLTLWQKVKNAFYAFADILAPLPLRWSEDEVLNDYKRLSAQDKIYLMSSLRHVMSVFSAHYFSVPIKDMLSVDTSAITKDRDGDRELRKMYGQFGKGLFSISDYFSLFPSIEHAYAAFYHVLRQTWKKMRIQDVRDGYSAIMAFLVLTRGTYHPEKVTL
jgi:hypothetical protein